MGLIVRERRVVVHVRRLAGYAFAIFFTFSQPLTGAQPVHLIGFVERMCYDEPYCFDLKVNPGYSASIGARIRVRFSGVDKIYDPENYELDLARQKIQAGSHLRLLLTPDASGRPGDYLAQIIWIGD